jgi:glucose/mannose transport system substrate-binding protein
MNRRKLGVLGWAVLCSSVQACGGSAPEDSARTDQRLEVFNWWTSPGETDAFNAVLQTYSQQYAQTTVVNSAVATFSKAQEKLQGRMETGDAPDTFQTLGGWSLWKWIAYNGVDDVDSKMEPIDFIAQQNDLARVIPKALMDLVSYNGKVYAIPLGVHRYNTLFFDKKVFDDNGLAPPTSLAEFYTVSEALKGKGLVPLAIGSVDGHQVKTHTWDGLLVAKAGIQFRESYLSGHEDPADPRVVDMLNEYAHMLEYSNADRDTLTWDAAAQLLVDGKAAMTIVGDFGKGFFLSKGWRAGIELGEVPLPGTRDTFVYLVDSFGLPRGIANRQATVNFLNLIATPDAENVFSPLKGASPPRKDVDRSAYDALANATMDDLGKCTLTRATNLMVKNTDFVTALNEAMRQFAMDRNVEAVINVLKNRYDLL